MGDGRWSISSSARRMERAAAAGGAGASSMRGLWSRDAAGDEGGACLWGSSGGYVYGLRYFGFVSASVLAWVALCVCVEILTG